MVSEPLVTTPTQRSDPPNKSPTHTQPLSNAQGTVKKKVAKVKPSFRSVESQGTSISVAAEPQEASPNPSPAKSNVSEREATPLGKGPSNPVSPICDTSTTTECVQLIRQLWNLREDILDFQRKLTALVVMTRRQVKCHNQEVTRSKVNNPSRSSSQTPLEITPLEPAEVESTPVTALLGLECHPQNSPLTLSLPALIFHVKGLTQGVVDAETQFNSLSAANAPFKLVLYAKVLHARKYVVHDHLALLYTLHQLIIAAVQLVAASGSAADDILIGKFVTACRLADIYNFCLDSVLRNGGAEPPAPNSREKGVVSVKEAELAKVRIFKKLNSFMTNDDPWLESTLKPLSATKLLNFYIQKRIPLVAHEFSRALILNFVPKATNQESSSDIALNSLEDCFKEEEPRKRLLVSALLDTASLGLISGEKSAKSLRRRLENYIQERLCACAGEAAKELLMWGSAQPLALASFSTVGRLGSALTLAAQMADSASALPLPRALFVISSSLQSFTLLLSWDHQIRTAFEIAAKIKRPEHTQLQSSAAPAQFSTVIGQHFADMLTTTLLLIDGEPCADRLQPNSPERFKMADEELLSSEAQTLFRLDASFAYFVAWVAKRGKAWLNNWAIPQFLAVSQRDTYLLWQLLNSRQAILITREILLNSESTSVRLVARQRQLCADDLRNTLNQLQETPKVALDDVGPICVTLALATLQSCMPSGRHWEGVGLGCGLDPDNPSPYVHTFISRVIDPVLSASVQLVQAPVQEAIGKEVVHAASEAWLQYILQKKLKFSEWGAVQLLRDFIALRQWIRSQAALAPEARKAILEMEILKRCEGVAYLLLRSPGDVLGVGKTVERSRRRSSSTQSPGGSAEASPSLSAAHDDIPPEMYVSNQQMWLDLRLRPRTLSLTSCC